MQNASRFKGRLVIVLVDGVIARANPRVDWIVTKMIRKLIGGELIGGEWCGGLCQIPTIDAASPAFSMRQVDRVSDDHPSENAVICGWV